MFESEGRVLMWMILAAIIFVPFQLPAFTVPHNDRGALRNDFISGKVYIVGDIMLGRDVERIMKREGDAHPFLGTKALVSSADLAVGNFEATVPEWHVVTPAFNFKLSVKKEYMKQLHHVGFDVLSLANNHSYDFDLEGYAHTKKVCSEYGMECIGDQTEDSGLLTYTTDIGSTRFGILALYAVDREPDTEAVLVALEKLTSTSDYQVVFIHWGEEYKLKHTEGQEVLAHSLIDAGVDAVVGHHPHVVEDIEIYNGKPIFYSLGNFIFDQYFNNEVQTGLTVQLTFEWDSVTYNLIPVSSIESRAQPHILPVDSRDSYVEELLARSNVPDSYIEGSRLRFPRTHLISND